MLFILIMERILILVSDLQKIILLVRMDKKSHKMLRLLFYFV